MSSKENISLAGGSNRDLHVFTIGHSNHPLGHFVSLLEMHSVQLVVDVRSHPYSRHAPQFNRKSLTQALGQAGVRYLYLGDLLGGRPREKAFYDSEGRVLYDKIAQSAAFQTGLSRLEARIHQHEVAILCAEENPTACHRRLLIGWILMQRRVALHHIRGDGRLQAERELLLVDHRKDCGGR